MPAERWQQWMPLDIDKFRGSPDVQMMHPASRSGYLYLLLSAWQSDDCTVSDDPMDLAVESGLGDDLWPKYGERVVRKFVRTHGGRLCNAALKEKWEQARARYEAGEQARASVSALRSEAGRIGAAKRFGKPAPPPQPTLTLEPTEGPEESLIVAKIPLADGSEFAITEKQAAAWKPAYPGVDVGVEMLKARNWCLANPRRRKTRAGVLKFAVDWLGRAQNDVRGERAANRPADVPAYDPETADARWEADQERERKLREEALDDWRHAKVNNPAFFKAAPKWVVDALKEEEDGDTTRN